MTSEAPPRADELESPSGAVATGARSRVFAFLLSAWEPGLGQFHAGYDRRALAFWLGLLAFALLYFRGLLGRSFAGAVAWLLLIVVLRLVAAVDGARVAARPGAPLRWFRRWYVCLPLGLALGFLSVAVFLEVRLLKSYRIPSVSMEPTIQPGDHLIAALDSFAAEPPERGRLVIIDAPNRPGIEMIKRVVAVGGDEIEIRGKQLLINGAPAEDPWAVFRDPQVGSVDEPSSHFYQRDHLTPVRVPDGHLFLMSDNRDYAFDSRFFGPVPVEAVRGEPLFVYWAADRSRIGNRLTVSAGDAR